MKIAPQTYYAPWPGSGPTEADWRLIWPMRCGPCSRKNRCVYGVRKMWHAAAPRWPESGRDQVGRLMRIAGIQGVRRGAHRDDAATTSAPRHPDLVNGGWKTPNRPDRGRVADFTYVWTSGGFCYVSFITDVYSRRILGWRCR